MPLTPEERRNAIVYQIYPRSFQDSNGDGVGDLRGITSRLGHIAELGCDAVWLSPIFVSPNADWGYDVSDYMNVDPDYGTLEDFDALVTKAHHLGLEVLLDIVPCHTSIEHPWFREHPDWYIWSPTDGVPNNWLSVFGNSAWEHDTKTNRYYMHTYYKEQADLDWHNPEVSKAMVGVIKTWLDRGADGFRIDALQSLYKDSQFRDNPTDHVINRQDLKVRIAEQKYTMNQPETFPALAKLREQVPDAFLVAEAGVDTVDLPPYLQSVDIAFCFEFLHSSSDVHRLASVIEEAAKVEGIAWVLSNHDFSHLVSRWGADLARVAALLLMTLPGAAFVYQGDEIGAIDGPGGEVEYDRLGRDRFRHPMQWDSSGGFSTAKPWLPMIDPEVRNVAEQMGDPDSMLTLYKSLIKFRKTLSGPLEMDRVDDMALSFRRNDHTVTINFSSEPLELSSEDGQRVVFATTEGCSPKHLEPHSGMVVQR